MSGSSNGGASLDEYDDSDEERGSGYDRADVLSRPPKRADSKPAAAPPSNGSGSSARGAGGARGAAAADDDDIDDDDALGDDELADAEGVDLALDEGDADAAAEAMRVAVSGKAASAIGVNAALPAPTRSARVRASLRRPSLSGKIVTEGKGFKNAERKKKAVKGKVIDGEHEQYALTYGMMLGISVRESAPAPRPVWRRRGDAGVVARGWSRGGATRGAPVAPAARAVSSGGGAVSARRRRLPPTRRRRDRVIVVARNADGGAPVGGA